MESAVPGRRPAPVHPVRGAAGPGAVSLDCMDTAEPHTKAGIKRVEVAGPGTAVVSVLAIWGVSTVLGKPSEDSAGRHVLLHFFGLSRDNICGWIFLISLLVTVTP